MPPSFDQFLANKSSPTATVSAVPSFGDFMQNRTPTPPEPSMWSKIGTGIKNYADTSAKTVDTLGNAILHPWQTMQKVSNAFTQPMIEGEAKGGEALYNLVSRIKTTNPVGALDLTNPQNIADTAKLISGFAQSVFSPVSGLFKIAENTPGLKQVADTINLPFTTTGIAGSWTSGKAVDWLPISQESKDIIKQPIQELSSLVAQVALGGKIMEKVGDFTSKGVDITPEVATRIVQDAKVETPQLHEPPTLEQHLAEKNIKAEIAKEPIPAKIEPQQSPELQQMQIEMEMLQEKINNNPLNGIETTKASVVNKKTGDIKVRNVSANFLWYDREGRIRELGDVKNPALIRKIEDKMAETGHTDPTEFASAVENYMSDKKRLTELKTQIKSMQNNPNAPTSEILSLEKTAQQSIGEESNGKVNPIQGTGEVKTRTLAGGVEAQAIEKKLTKSFGDLPEYRQMNIKDQAQKAIDLMNNDYERAKRIALGNEVAPEGIHPESLFTAVEERATREGDVNTLKNLATQSSLTTEATTMGQRIRLLGERNPESPVMKIKEVKDSRENALAKKGIKKGDVVSEIQREIKANVSKRPTWEEFINEIKCNY